MAASAGGACVAAGLGCAKSAACRKAAKDLIRKLLNKKDKKVKAKERRKQDKLKNKAPKDGTPGNNQAQNKQFRDATQGLSKAQKRRVHDLVTGKNKNFHEIRRVAERVKNGKI